MKYKCFDLNLNYIFFSSYEMKIRFEFLLFVWTFFSITDMANPRNLTHSSGSTVGWVALIYILIGVIAIAISTVLWKMGKNRYVK